MRNIYTYTSLSLLQSLSGVIAMIPLVQAFVPLLSLGLHFILSLQIFARFLLTIGGSGTPHLILVHLLDIFSSYLITLSVLYCGLELYLHFKLFFLDMSIMSYGITVRDVALSFISSFIFIINVDAVLNISEYVSIFIYEYIHT